MAKSAVIVGAYDTRFALVCANGGGLKPLADLPYVRFPNWFKPKASPLAHEQADLLKCIAPRALFVSSAADDRYQPTTMANATADAAEDAWSVGKRYGVPSERVGEIRRGQPVVLKI